MRSEVPPPSFSLCFLRYISIQYLRYYTVNPLMQVWGVMSMHPHTVNYTHFAQLFMQQLQTMSRSVHHNTFLTSSEGIPKVLVVTLCRIAFEFWK